MKKIAVLLILISISLGLYGQTVVKEELFKVKRDSVEFFNYEGPHQKIETVDEIRGIGAFLGKTTNSVGVIRTYSERYSIIHLVDTDGQGSLNADVFIIENDAVVDHIDNVRRIISGYLEQAYSYSREDSDILAEFATYYNAVYRGNFPYFQSAYNKIVTEFLDPDSTGISTRYLEWPGKTQIVIPLSASGEKKIESDVISNQDVIEDLRTKEDKGIEPRKEIVELKEREIEDEQDKIEEQKKGLQEDSIVLEAEKEQLKEDSETLSDSDLKDRENEITEKEIVLDEKEKDLQVREEKQQERQEDVKKERGLIAEDEKKIIEEEKSEPAVIDENLIETIPFLIIDGKNTELMGRLALINTKTGEIYKQSSINTVRGRRYYLSGKQMLIVSGIDKAPQAVRLMFLDSNTLEVITQGNYDVFSDTDLLLDRNNIYAVVRENDSWYIGRFNTELILQERSGEEVLSYTPLQLNGGILYVQLSDGKVVPLNPDTLKIIKE